MTFTRNSRTLAVAIAMLVAWSFSAAADVSPKPTARRVVATYFHRTVRCPTCQKVGASLEEAIKRNFAAELADGRLEWRMMDFQDPRNAGFATAFGVTGPAFILMDVQDNRVIGWKPAPKAWSLIGDPVNFSRYVQTEVRSVLGVQATAAK
jgi:hypothetical protein